MSKAEAVSWHPLLLCLFWPCRCAGLRLNESRSKKRMQLVTIFLVQNIALFRAVFLLLSHSQLFYLASRSLICLL